MITYRYVECIWKVIAPNGELLVVDFIERFDLTSSRNCTDEFVEIRDGSTTAASLVGKFCQDKPSTQYTTSNMARIHYFTDVSVPKNGFKAKISMAKCGGSFTSWSGFISSKNYPGLGTHGIVLQYHPALDLKLSVSFHSRRIS